MMKLADAIFTKEVSIKNNKLPSAQQREGVTLQEWCQTRKRMRIVQNELMAEIRGKDLPSKKKEYIAYADEEWDDLAREKNLNDETVKNIVIEMEQDKVGLESLERRGHPLAPTQRDVDLDPTVYVEAVAKFAKVNVGSTSTSSALRFSIDVAASLTDALANLPAIDRLSKLEIVVVFSYDTQGESLYVRPSDVVSLNARILREDDSQDEDVDNQPRRVLLAPAIFICDSVGSVNVQGFTTKS